MTANQTTFQYTDDPLSDAVSSYNGALQKTDGTTYWLEQKEANTEETGLQISNSVLRSGKKHHVSFMIQATEGALRTLGGLVPGNPLCEVQIDGQEVTGRWKTGVDFTPDDKPHFVMVTFTPTLNDAGKQDPMTILLNKDAGRKSCKVLLTDLNVFQGTH